MEKLKAVFSPGSSKDDEAMYNTPSKDETAGATGKVTGQGSHFGSSEGSSGTAPTTETSTYQPTTTTGLKSTTAPVESRSTEPIGSSVPQSYESGAEPASTSMPQRLESSSEPTDDSAYKTAVGDTSTYNSNKLGSGDATSSVVDPNSSGSTTFKKPESSTGTGVGSGAALTAASTAFSHGKDREATSNTGTRDTYPGGGASNPYASSNLDPRVDGGTVHDRVTAGSAEDSNLPSARAGAALGAGAGAGTGAYEASRPTEISSTAPASSNTTAATDPTNRSAAYTGGTGSREFESATHTTSGTTAPATTRAVEPEEETSHKKSKMGGILGALGLGGAAAAGKGKYDERKASNDGSAVGDSTTARAPPSHHRKESIPTTAYPSGSLGGARDQPIGGTGPPPGTAATTEGHYAAPAAAAASGAGATGLAAGVYGQERRRSSTPHEIEQQARRDSWRMQAAGAFGGGPESYDQARRASRDRALAAGTGAQTESREKSHLGRDAGIGAGVVGGAGAAAFGAHEYGQGHESQPATSSPLSAVPATTAAETGRRDESHLGRDATITGAGGAGAGAVAEHQYSNKEHKKAEKAAVKEEKAREKEEKKEHKAAEKEAKREEKEERKRADKEAAAAVAGMAGGAGLGVGAGNAANTYRDSELDKQRAIEDPLETEEGRALGAPGLGSGSKDAARQYREAELEKQRAMEDPAPGTYSGSGLGSGLQQAGAGYSSREMERHRGEADPEIAAEQSAGPASYSKGAEGAAAGAGVGALGAYEAEKHSEAGPSANEPWKSGQSTTTGTTTGGLHSGQTVPETATTQVEPAGTSAHKDHYLASATDTDRKVSTGSAGFGLAAADAADHEKYSHNPDKKKGGFFRRIFKRRKNKDTGESEDYSSDEEHDGTTHDTTTHGSHGTHGTTAGTAAGTTAGTTTGTAVTEGDGAGFSKPSYNPFKSNEKEPEPAAIDSAGHY